MSSPISRLRVTETPSASNSRRNASTSRSLTPFSPRSLTLLSGIRLTWHYMPRMREANSRACAGDAFTPCTSAYSKITRRPVFSM